MKIKEFQKKLSEKRIDAAILYNMETGRENANISYLSGYKGYGFLVVPAKKSPFLIVPLLDIEYALKSKMRFYIMKEGFIEKIAKKIGMVKRIGVEATKFSIFAKKKFSRIFKKARFIDISPLIGELRMTKTEKEFEIIKEASDITNKIMEKCINNFKNFGTEKDIYNYLKIECVKNNVEPSFDFVVASGMSPATPHHIPTQKPLRKGFCVIDFGIRYKGYCTDITRTVYIGNPSEKERRIYNLVLDVQKNAIKNIKIGRRLSDIDKNARKEFGKYAKKFIHSLGHGLGIEVHEQPTISSLSKEKIKEGMYFTIEPGLYFPLRFGIRIEDDIFIHKGKVVNLTKVPKELLIVKPKNF